MSLHARAHATPGCIRERFSFKNMRLVVCIQKENLQNRSKISP